VTQEAVLLADGSSPEDVENLAKVLQFFGVPYRSMTADQFLTSCPKGSKPKLLLRGRRPLALDDETGEDFGGGPLFGGTPAFSLRLWSE